MKPKQSYAEYLKDWRNLLGHVAADATLTDTFAMQRLATLAAVVARLDELHQQQTERNSAKQAVSEEMRLLVIQGRELSRDIKLEVKGRLGARSLELVKFQVTPLRLSRRVKTETPEVPPQGGAEGGQQPETTPAASRTANPTTG